MKRISILATAVVILAGTCFAQNPQKSDYLQLAWPVQYTNGTAYSPASGTNGYDLTAYNGFAKLIVTVSGDEGIVTSTNGTVAIQHSTLSTGTYTRVEDVSSNMPSLTTTGKCVVIDVNLEKLKNWARIEVYQSSLGETGCAHTVGAVLVVPHKSD
jgi:hypothetical protein